MICPRILTDRSSVLLWILNFLCVDDMHSAPCFCRRARGTTSGKHRSFWFSGASFSTYVGEQNDNRDGEYASESMERWMKKQIESKKGKIGLDTTSAIKSCVCILLIIA